jgi:pimeloyl-ACP methyl ester carboxylesterase
MIVEWNFAPQAPPRLVELARQRMADTQPAVLLGDLMACDGFDVISRLGEIDCPTLVICGEEDRMTPMRYAQYLANHIKGARIEIIQGAGHMVMLEKPQEVRNRMLEFLRTISDGASSQAEL